jgi:mRNA interferase MazF
VWWADLSGGAGRRPVLLLSRNEAYSVRGLITVAPITTRVRGIPVEVALGPDDGLPRACVANLDSLTTVPKVWLRERICQLPPAKIEAVAAAVRFALALDT